MAVGTCQVAKLLFTEVTPLEFSALYRSRFRDVPRKLTHAGSAVTRRQYSVDGFSSIATRSQLSGVVLRVLVPPSRSMPGRNRTFIVTSTPFQCSIWFP